ncbi:hypothetical protein LZ31DRAFT_288626 [Colletotrichum somersetense]|nr:hypothetical protein LZ31DRAFT_288626 [Colletotrichum somersetense]
MSHFMTCARGGSLALAVMQANCSGRERRQHRLMQNSRAAKNAQSAVAPLTFPGGDGGARQTIVPTAVKSFTFPGTGLTEAGRAALGDTTLWASFQVRETNGQKLVEREDGTESERALPPQQNARNPAG